MAIVSQRAGRPGRWVEFLLLLLALAIGLYAYLQVGLATTGTPPAGMVTHVGVLVLLALGAHVVLRWRAPYADPVILPTAKEYSYTARGGSWDDDPEGLRAASRKVSNREWSVQDPQRPQSIWWHTDATFVGLRVVRPLAEQENLKGFRSPVVKGKGTR